MKKQWKTIIIILAVLFVASWLVSSILSVFTQAEPRGNVAVIPVKGMITADSGSYLSTVATSSSKVRGFIEKAEDDSAVKAMIIEINSPGGSAVASEEIARAIQKTNKTTVAWIRESGTSGAYWIAASTDHVISSGMSLVGSVGVLSSTLGFSEFLSDYNITYRRVVGGEYKDIASPLKNMTLEEKSILQQKVNLIHAQFLDEIVSLRNLSNKAENEIGSGLFYTGTEAKELGLVDELGNKPEVIKYLEQELNTSIKTKTYHKEKTFIQTLSQLMSEQSYFLGRGIGTFLNSNDVLITT